MDQQAFERGRQQASASLNAWQRMGHNSYDACRQHLQRYYQCELAHAQEQAAQVQDLEHRAFWQRYVDFFQGCLAGLDTDN